MAAGIAIVAVSSILAGFSGSFAQLIVLRGIGGLGSAMFSVSAQTLLLVSVPAISGGGPAASSRAVSCSAASAAPRSAGCSRRGRCGRRSSSTAACCSCPPSSPRSVLRDSPRGTARGRPRAERPLAEIIRALRSRAYRAAASANLADGFAAMGVRSAIVPLFVRDVLHKSAVWTGIGFLVVAALNAATLLPGGRFADTLGRRPVIVAGCLISGASMAMLALLPGLWGFLAALAVLGSAPGCSMSRRRR